MSFSIQEFLESCKGSLALTEFIDVAKEGETQNVYRLSFALRPHKDMLKGMSPSILAKIAQAGAEPDFAWAEWREDLCMLQLRSSMRIDELGKVDIGEAFGLINFLNGKEDRISALRITEDDEGSQLVHGKASLMIPHNYLTDPLQVDALRVIFRNTFARFVTECYHNTVQITMALMKGRN